MPELPAIRLRQLGVESARVVRRPVEGRLAGDGLHREERNAEPARILFLPEYLGHGDVRV
jgi:hypothetical protein